jgi:hypothetical protein
MNMTSERYYIVGFEPDRIISSHPSYSRALLAWSARGSLPTEAVRSSDDPRWRYAGHINSPAPRGFLWATPTPDEVADWKRHYNGTAPRQKRLVCEDCGTRIWGSGIGVGSHRRACPQTHRKKHLAAKKAS